jgi:hypothetical protein
MYTKRFLIAVSLSFAVHFFWIFSVSIVTPGKMIREKIYTQVKFLGSIIGKTAFDFMLERSDPYNFSYKHTSTPETESLLEVNNEKKDIQLMGRIPGYEKYFESILYPSLLAKKNVPGIFNRGENLSRERLYSGRKVISRPDPPVIQKGVYGNHFMFRLRFSLLVSADGKVKVTKLTSSTGYPEVDTKATNYIKKWIFEPRGDPYSGEETVEAEIIIVTERD